VRLAVCGLVLASLALAEEKTIPAALALELSLASNAANAAETSAMLALRKSQEATETAVTAARNAERAAAMFAAVRERAKAACGGVDPVSDGKTITCPSSK